MEITAAMVKQLREMTGAGVMNCKRALVETDGDFDKAIEVLREKGEATAVKKAGRIAAEGTVLAVVKEDKEAVIVEVNSETDFVAKNEKFRTFVADVAEQIFASSADTVEALSEEAWVKDSSKTVKEELVSQIAVIGENLSIRRFKKINTDGIIVAYVHGGGRIGVLDFPTGPPVMGQRPGIGPGQVLRQAGNGFGVANAGQLIRRKIRNLIIIQDVDIGGIVPQRPFIGGQVNNRLFHAVDH